MRRLQLLCLVLAGTAFLTDPVLDACGSKFLVGARSARYQRLLVTMNPARILWYYEEKQDTPEDERWDPEFEAYMEKVGHTIEVAGSFDELRSAMRAGKFDIVILEIDYARELRSELESLSPGSVLLPVLEFPSRPEYSKAKREFGTVLKFPSTESGILSTIEKAQQARGV